MWFSASLEFGDAFFKKNTMQGAAREGARLAITSGATNTSVTTATRAVMTAAGINSANYTVAITDTNNNAISNVGTVAVGTAIKVTVSGQWRNIGLRPLGIINSTKQITGTAVMRKESD